ncbi:cobalamin B12-binding domain-containing protein [Paenibacillus sp. MWE-103]|uniref:Cobalamin B12-binding domain-containing protein n=2 Tax=Paenibacillus artemisiicola TaxID=1172618 RepID=A0ABS3WHM5_9BACL|nr:cobalamin B12-binding domain-containing protein [Paenibacillus artemisiicola]
MEPEHFAELLIGGQAEACWAKIEAFVGAGANSLFIFDRVLTPAMRYIGSLWEHNVITVADEHVASGLCDLLISRYEALLGKAPANGRRAMLLCVEGETHALGLKMVAALFREQGWEARFYGADLPLEYALASALSWKPDAIGLSVSIVYHLPRLRDYVDAFGRLPREPAILLGGRLTEPYLAHRRAAERVVPTPGLLELSEWLAADTERGARRTSRELSGR